MGRVRSESSGRSSGRDCWPLWAGFGIVTLVMLLAAGTLAYGGKSRITPERRMPRTVDTLKENMQWMRARAS